MPPSKKFQASSVALAESDRIALAKLANELGKSKGQVARDAVRWYVQNHELISSNEKEDQLVRVILKSTDRIIGVIKNCTNRICSLQVRTIIDTNLTMMLFYRMLPASEADKVMSHMYRMAVSRVMRKIPPDELKIANMIREGLEEELLDEELPRAS
ncbi:MAG: hypothetical protein EKK48_10470 [Candidatus Melainabacteria bacterium]|nr:MAG: hypothetical protein EKK48_10470 [Candidatus Melainabacteria bacterium]